MQFKWSRNSFEEWKFSFELGAKSLLIKWAAHQEVKITANAICTELKYERKKMNDKEWFNNGSNNNSWPSRSNEKKKWHAVQCAGWHRKRMLIT